MVKLLQLRLEVNPEHFLSESSANIMSKSYGGIGARSSTG